MALINEIPLGTSSEYNGMNIFRKYDGERGFQPYFKFINDDTLSLESNIVVNYIQYYKNSSGVIIDKLTEYKNYVVGNITEELYEAGEEMAAGKIAIGGEIVPGSDPVEYYSAGDPVAAGTIAIGGEIKRNQWYAANDWFIELARTPITAPYGVMDSIEATLAGLPVNIPNGYILQEPLS